MAKIMMQMAGLGLLLLATGSAFAEPVAKLENADGTVYVKRVSGKQSILSAGSSLEVGDTVSTEKDSYARLRFIDGGEVAIRPLSSLQVSKYQFKEADPSNDGAVMRLLKGGLRTVTGLIGKRGNQDAYELRGGTSTIGIRGTEFVARLCQNDCAVAAVDSKKKPASVANQRETPVVARLAETRGMTYVTSVTGARLHRKVGEPIYAGDTIDVAPEGHAVLVFSDEARVSLNGGSRYVMTSVRLNSQQPEKSAMGVDLLKGGLRMLTGLLGKAKPQNVQVRTSVATIGIRGTNFDIVCAQTGSQERQEDPMASGAVQCDQALYAQTRDGVIELTSGENKLRLGKGQVAYIDSPGAVPALLKETPAFLQDNPTPKPETLSIDMVGLFGVDGRNHDQPGLYAEVKEGKITLNQANGQGLLVQAGEVAFAGSTGDVLYKLNESPDFSSSDPWLRGMRIDPAACRAN